jgi:hypothetical protein
VDVVGLQPITAAAASDRADPLVSHPDVTAGAEWDRFGKVRRTYRTTVPALKTTRTWPVQRISESVLGPARRPDESITPVSPSRVGSVDEDFGDGHVPPFGSSSEAVEADRGKGVCHAFASSFPTQRRQFV